MKTLALKNASRLYFTKHTYVILTLCLTFFTCFLYAMPGPYFQPFMHGVASGDPMPDRVIIWTRVSPQATGTISVSWQMASDSLMRSIVKTGQTTTGPSKDYTVKIDVSGLSSGKSYYYRFLTNTLYSPIGKTKTAPVNNVSVLRFAVVSCSNYAEGYFTALGKIAARANLDAVIHLGDYIYEGTERDFDKRSKESLTLMAAEVGAKKTKSDWLKYYRDRYAISHTDANLNKAHQNLAFITVWDDHETADNAYKDGANYHDPLTDGPWTDRKAAAKQAYFEWMPIRGNGPGIYRSLRFGNLMELLMLDTRLEGRDKQIYEASSPDLSSPKRTILGLAQKKWLLNKLKMSTVQWKVVGNQVIFSPFHVSWAKIGPFSSQVAQLEGNLLDYWQGYPAERDSVIKFIARNNINNVVILSASMHCSLAFDVILQPKDLDNNTSDKPLSVAVEFATPSITSANFDEKIGETVTKAFEARINQQLPPPFNFNPNPHLKFVDLKEHGYLILELTSQKAQAKWYFIDDKFSLDAGEKFIDAWYTNSNENRLNKSSGK